MAYLVNNIPKIVNDAAKDALGKTAGLTEIDTTDIVSLGKQISAFEAFDGFFNSLVNRISRTIYFIRTYESKTRSVLRDEQEYGAFIQKVYYELPDAVDNPTYAIPNAENHYVQQSPYDVEGIVKVSSLVFGGQGTWSIEIIRPLEQIKTAFLNMNEMNSFIDGIYVAIENSYKLHEERLVSLAVNTAMASALDGGKSRNLLAEYNAKHAGANLTVASALENLDFLKYTSMEINRVIDNLQVMSTAYNKDGYNTFTPKDKMVIEMLSHFAYASDMYLQSDTFHNELVKLPNYEKVPFWQSSGNDFNFETCSSIDVVNDSIKGGVALKQSGIICFIHDIENVAAYFGERREWSMQNPRSDVMIHGLKARKGFGVDNHANAIVFYMAET